MKTDKPRTTPDVYINFGGDTSKKLSYKDQFEVKASSAETPWVPSRFGQSDLLRAVSNRRLNLNHLNFVPEGVSDQPYEMFPGKGRFAMEQDYDFAIGRPQTPNFPEQQPDFDPNWNNAYTLSPVIKPEEKIKNPFPRQDNLDPNGYLQAMMEEGTTTDIQAMPELIDENPKSSISIS
jgi:hypothetical protein